MRGFTLVLLWHLHATPEPAGDSWFATDKVKHFVTAAFVESLSFSALRTTGLRRSPSLVAAAGVGSAVSIGKEVYDAKCGGDPSIKDLVWDGAGLAAAAALLSHTQP